MVAQKLVNEKIPSRCSFTYYFIKYGKAETRSAPHIIEKSFNPEDQAEVLVDEKGNIFYIEGDYCTYSVDSFCIAYDTVLFNRYNLIETESIPQQTISLTMGYSGEEGEHLRFMFSFVENIAETNNFYILEDRDGRLNFVSKKMMLEDIKIKYEAETS